MIQCLQLLLAAQAQPPPPGGFLLQCESDNDYGWPRFTSQEELKASRWASYFNQVYGELPVDYPVCVYDLWHLDGDAYRAAGLSGSRPIVDAKAAREGDLFDQPSTTTDMNFGIYHGVWTPIPNNTWVEVTHAVFPTELAGAWVWNARGSGVWVNTGTTKVFPTPADVKKVHADAIAWLTEGCSVKVSPKWPLQESDIFGRCAREKGIDTVQFEPQQGQQPIGSFNLTGLTEMVVVNADGDKNCGVANASATPLRAGWKATSQCDCTNGPIADSCGLMAKPPFPMNIFGETPRLCELREKRLSASCTQATCQDWKCDVRL